MLVERLTLQLYSSGDGIVHSTGQLDFEIRQTVAPHSRQRSPQQYKYNSTVVSSVELTMRLIVWASAGVLGTVVALGLARNGGSKFVR